MDLKKWTSSRKTLDMLSTQGILLLVIFGILWMSGGDPDKAKALGEALLPYVGMIGGVGGIKILGQSHVDAKTAAKGVEAKPEPEA